MAADPIDERYDEIVRELRALPGAPAELRERVRRLGSAADLQRPRRRGLTQAVARFTALGTIQSQHIAIRDLQDQANAEELRILRLRKTAVQLQEKLRGQLTPEERVRLQSQLDAVRGLLRVKTQQHRGTLRQGRLSTFQLELTTRKAAAAVPGKPGRIERAARHAFSALSKTIAGVLYALIVLSPLLVLVAAGRWASRYRRRRVQQRLLARARRDRARSTTARARHRGR